jgi:hypothetical protein
MMEVPGHIVCDVCGLPMGAEKGWFMAVTQTPPPEDPDLHGIAFGPMEAYAEFNDIDLPKKHVCGQRCAIKKFVQWLDSLNAVQTTQQSEAQ